VDDGRWIAELLAERTRRLAAAVEQGAEEVEDEEEEKEEEEEEATPDAVKDGESVFYGTGCQKLRVDDTVKGVVTKSRPGGLS
jgi:hypothetical protein